MLYMNLLLFLLTSCCFCQTIENSFFDCGTNYVLFDQLHGEVTPECDQGCPEVDSCESCQELCDLEDTCEAYECNHSEDKITCSFNGHLTVTDECGPLCQTQNICVKNSTLVDGTNFVSPTSQNRRELWPYYNAPYCYSGFRDRTNGNAYWWWCGRDCPGGMYWTDVSCNCACQGELGLLNEKLAPTIQSMVFGWTGKLDVGQDMLDRLNGECSEFSDYKIIKVDKPITRNDQMKWQCGSTFFEHGGKTYSPNQNVKNDMKEVFGLTEEDLDIPFFPNGYHQGNSERSAWCGMPSPEATGFEEPKRYWENCVMQNSGYFNTLKCVGASGKVHAVLGIAALNPNVCYPTHAHLNEEAYWQIGGTGSWKAWSHKNGKEVLQNADNHLNYANPSHREMALATYEHYEDGMQPFNAVTEVDAGDCHGLNTVERHDHPAGVVHEMSTQSNEHMLMVYWWAVNEDNLENKNTKYHFAHYVLQDSCSEGRIYQKRLSSGHMVPDDSIPSRCHPRFMHPIRPYSWGRRKLSTSRLLSDSSLN